MSKLASLRENLNREEKEMYEKYRTKIVPGTTDFNDDKFETKVPEDSTDVIDMEVDTDKSAAGSIKSGNYN